MKNGYTKRSIQDLPIDNYSTSNVCSNAMRHCDYTDSPELLASQTPS